MRNHNTSLCFLTGITQRSYYKSELLINDETNHLCGGLLNPDLVVARLLAGLVHVVKNCLVFVSTFFGIFFFFYIVSLVDFLSSLSDALESPGTAQTLLAMS